MSWSNIVDLAFYRITEAKEKSKKEDKLCILSGDQLAILELKRQHDALITELEKLRTSFNYLYKLYCKKCPHNICSPCTIEAHWELVNNEKRIIFEKDGAKDA
jgi:hypothetical protein